MINKGMYHGSGVTAVKVIVYYKDKDPFVYKLGDPTKDKEIGLEIDYQVESDYDTIDSLLDSAKIFKTMQTTEVTFKVRV